MHVNFFLADGLFFLKNQVWLDPNSNNSTYSNGLSLPSFRHVFSFYHEVAIFGTHTQFFKHMTYTSKFDKQARVFFLMIHRHQTQILHGDPQNRNLSVNSSGSP